MFRNQQNLYPRVATAIAELLQYSGLGSNTGMGFFMRGELRWIENGVSSLDFSIFAKTVEVNVWKLK